jgi:hypothetical protein
VIDLALSPLLLAQPAVTALVGNAIYPEELPDDAALPAITYRLVGVTAGPTWETAGMYRYRVQFDCWALTALAAVNLRNALVASLNGFVGAAGGVNIQNAQVATIGDFYQHEAMQYRRMVDFYFLSTS